VSISVSRVPCGGDRYRSSSVRYKAGVTRISLPPPGRPIFVVRYLPSSARRQASLSAEKLQYTTDSTGFCKQIHNQKPIIDFFFLKAQTNLQLFLD